MTKYILHGGETSRQSEDNNKFFFEMTKVDKSPVKILCVYFAREVESWGKLFDQDQKCFSSVAPTKVLSFTKAVKDLKIFEEQIKDADVIYMRGGVTEDLLSVLRPFENFGRLLTNKVVSGSSAGVCVLARYFHSGTIGTHARPGLGLLPIKTFVHYTEEKHAELKELEGLGQQLPIYKIAEEKFVIVQN